MTNDKIMRVAAYCRVSTKLEEQQSSLDAQISAFQRVIQDHPGWTMVGIYADKGLSGTSIKKRKEFLRMMDDARSGLIDYIMVKSISRFSRNTVDLLAYVRELKELGVSVYFEKERLDTGSATSEFLLSIFAAAAQEEIVSLSNNMKTGRRMRYASGYDQWVRVYGYRKGASQNEWLIIEKEAKIIRRIFGDYLNGISLSDISSDLIAEGVPTPEGRVNWTSTKLSIILHNEKYKGDLRMQKSYTADPIQHKRVQNRNGHLKQYYVDHHHEPIVDADTWDRVQILTALKDNRRGAQQYPYYGILKCPLCGANMIRFSHYRSPAILAWTCGGVPSPDGVLRQNRSSCPPYYIIEKYINHAVNTALREKHGDRHWIPERVFQSPPVYKTLVEEIQTISFTKWDILRIWWNDKTTTEHHIQFAGASDIPYPIMKSITTENGQTKWLVNGEPLKARNAQKQIQSIQHAQNDVLHIRIEDAAPYEIQVPHVTTPRSMKLRSSKLELLE